MREIAHLCVQTQHDDHDEEAHGPQLRHRHHGHRSGEGDEGQTRTCEEQEAEEEEQHQVGEEEDKNDQEKQEGEEEDKEREENGVLRKWRRRNSWKRRKSRRGEMGGDGRWVQKVDEEVGARGEGKGGETIREEKVEKMVETGMIKREEEEEK